MTPPWIIAGAAFIPKKSYPDAIKLGSQPGKSSIPALGVPIVKRLRG